MIDRFLRQLAVRYRIVGAFLILVALLALSFPLIVNNQSFLLDRLQQVTEAEARADRLLLLAAARVESSQANLWRYLQDYAPNADEAQNDADQAALLLTEVQELITSRDRKQSVATIRAALNDYQQLIGQVETAYSQGEEQEVSPFLFQATELRYDIGDQIEQIVGESDVRVSEANMAVRNEARDRLVLLGSGYLGVVLLALILAILIQRSITRPISELRSGAEAFRQGQMETTIPVVGSDELSLLARTFNQMTDQLADLVSTLEQRVSDRTSDLTRHARYLEATAAIARDAAAMLDLQGLLSGVVELISDQFGFYHAGLFLLDPSGEWAVLQAASSEGGQRMLARSHRLQVNTGIVGTAIAQGQPRIALDVGEDAVFFDNPDLPETRSEMALPLHARGEVIGALDVQRREPGAFSDEDVAVLQVLADQVAVAISNARLFQQAQESLEAERRAYGELSQESWRQMIRTRANTGYHSDERGLSPIGDIGYPQMETALQKGKTLPGQDRAGGMLVPIKVREQVIGVIDAQKPDGSGEWTQEEIALLQTMVDQLGVALDSARLYQDAQRSAVEDRLIGEITTRMRETLAIDNVLQTAIREMGSALDIPKVEVRMRPGVFQPASGRQ